MKRLLLLVARLYPPDWRHRYGREMSDLVSDADPRPADLLDLARGALSAHLARSAAKGFVAVLGRGAWVMIERSSGQAERLARIGLAVTLPTAGLVGLALLKYVIGVPGPFDTIEPVVTPFVTHPIGETVLTLAPYLALVLALVPVVRPHFGWKDGRLTGDVELSVPLMNAIVALLSSGLIAIMFVYWVAENL